MTPLPPSLSAKDGNSFAYPTMKDRIPVILSKIVDYLNRHREALVQEFNGDGSDEELKTIIGAMSCLRYQVMTNKAAEPLKDSASDAIVWNQDLERQTELYGGEAPKWFNNPWLWMECYMYRRIQEAVMMSSCFKSLDVFGHQKKDAFNSSFGSISQLTMHLYQVTSNASEKAEIDENFKDFLQISLWGNKCDLSISSGEENNQTLNPVHQLESLKSNILVDDTDAILQLLHQKQVDPDNKGAKVSIVLDNAGFEFVTDLCLAHVLLSSGLASSIHFHGKAMPWFVSDVTAKDVEWVFGQMAAMNHLGISRMVQALNENIESGKITFEYDPFWTMAHQYCQMESLCPELYSKLSQSDLVIFKGDLNYRKLVGDLSWDTTVEFSEALQGFNPTAICSLRTLKADVVVGLKPGQAEKVKGLDNDWMTNGKWSVISFATH